MTLWNTNSMLPKHKELPVALFSLLVRYQGIYDNLQVMFRIMLSLSVNRIFLNCLAAVSKLGQVIVHSTLCHFTQMY